MARGTAGTKESGAPGVRLEGSREPRQERSRRTLDRIAGATEVRVDPHPGNGRAIRCYEKAGFERVDEITTPDGPALMMCLWRAATR